jgi:hypothetical protein
LYKNYILWLKVRRNFGNSFGPYEKEGKGNIKYLLVGHFDEY